MSSKGITNNVIYSKTDIRTFSANSFLSSLVLRGLPKS